MKKSKSKGGKVKKITIAKATRDVLESYPRGKIFAMQEDVSGTGLLYDIAEKIGRWPSREAVKKAMQKLQGTICIDQWKGHYQKK